MNNEMNEFILWTKNKLRYYIELEVKMIDRGQREEPHFNWVIAHGSAFTEVLNKLKELKIDD